MDQRRNFKLTLQILILIAAVALLAYWASRRPAVVMSDDAVDDLIEEVGDTYVPVHAGNIERSTLHQYVTAFGRIEPAAATKDSKAASVDVASPVAGIVAKLDCYEGQHVSSGQPLFSLDTTHLDAEIERCKAIIAADEKLAAFERQDLFLLSWPFFGVERQAAVDRADLALLQSQRDRLGITAPIAGVITQLNIAAGASVDPARSAVRIVDLDRLVASVDLSLESLRQVRPGQPATVEFTAESTASNDSALSGTVVLIDAVADVSTGMGSVDIALPAGSGLMPGQFVRARIVVGEEADRLSVPIDAITRNAAGQTAIGRIETDGRWAVLVPVQTGWREGDRVEVTGEGLAADQPIVTLGSYGLVQRTRLNLLKN
jgi:membrane fusion protein (multidrug efflux system)